MSQRQNGMPPNHSSPRVAHNQLNHSPHFRRIAMNGALITNGLISTKRTRLIPPLRISQQLRTIRTQPLMGAVMIPTINAHHYRYGF